MKKFLKRISVLCICATLIVVSLLTPVAAATTGIYELTFDNLFIFEQWANHPNLKVYAGDSSTSSILTTDIENGSFVLTNNTSDTEVFTAFSMGSVGAFYSMPVEENTEYMFSYVANGTTTNFETFVFYFDKSGQYTTHEAKNAYQYGLNEWSFTTPENTGYIQVRFDNNSPNSDVTVSDIRICSKEIYEFSKDLDYRKTFTYSAGSAYGALPVPKRQNLVFAGWFTGPDGTGEKITSSTIATPASICLFSKWDPIVVGDLSVVSLPIKQEYCVGDKLDTKGLVIGVTYPDGTSENIDEGFTCSPLYLTTAGSQTVTITYGGSTAEFDVTVKNSDSFNLLLNNAQYPVTVSKNTYTFNYSGMEFNRYVIKYSSDAYVKGELNCNGTVEEFFLEPAENGEFSGYIDGFLAGTTRTAITDITFKPLDKEFMDFTFDSLALSKEATLGDASGMVYLSSSDYKIGIDLDWGGALTYLEDLSNDVVTAQKRKLIGTNNNPVEVGLSSDYEDSTFTKYNRISNVNLINAHDTGRLVQQSYYGTGSYPYEPGMYGETVWNYNPVQGGNLYNEASKIVDLKVTDNEIYIKCRPLDWAKEAKDITPSYMEAWYTLEDGLMRATCRFVDFSGYPAVTTTQEVPAFYCVEPLNNFVYYSGGEAWADSNTKVTLPDLDFWGTATDQDYQCNENWAAFIGDGESGYGIGLYTPGQTLYHPGVYQRDTLKSLEDSDNQPAANHDSTSYIGVVDTLYFQSYNPISYCYYITTGNVDTIRSNFKALAQSEADICNATNTNGFCDMCGKPVAPRINENNVYEISNVGELYWFRNNVNNGAVNANAVLTCDLTDNSGVLTAYGTLASDASAFRKWTPIGTSSNKYNGHFDGQGFTINGLYMNDSALSYGGLFGYTASGAVIEKVGVDYSYFKGNQYIGGICGYNNGKIDNCYSFYTMIQGSSSYAGGITGYNNGTVQNCYNAGLVDASNYAGGIAGQKANAASISNCYYLLDAAPADTTGVSQGKTIEEFASGEVAYLLQSANSEQVWGQKTNATGSGPVFDKSGNYKVNAVENQDSYALVGIGDIDEDDDIDVIDYQQLVNKALSGKTVGYKDMLSADIDYDGYLDVIDCALMQLIISGYQDKVDVYLKGDFDCDGIPYTQEDITAMKKGLVNQDKINTRQKYACDLNMDYVLDINDKDLLLQQSELSVAPVFTNIEEAIGLRSEKANVIILCGQSNAYGASPLTQAVRDSVGSTDFSNIKIKYNNINTYDGTNWATLFSNNEFEEFRLGIGGQADMWFGPEVGLSYYLATNEETKNEKWYIIKYTAAGTFLGGDWLYDTSGKYLNQANSQNIYNSLGGYLADLMIPYVNNALDEIVNMHGVSNVNIRSFMWMQGESDSLVKEWADQYGDLQNILVNRVRTEFESRDADNKIGFVDGAIAAYNSTTFVNPQANNATQTYNSWVYSDTVNTNKANNASLWYVPVATSKNVINKTTAGLYTNASTSSNKLSDSIWIDTSTCKSKLENNIENGEYDGAHYCGDSMFKIGQWFGYGMTQVS